MDLRLTMLTQNTALQLYRVSKESQLLRRLGGDWYTPQPHDFPLPTPNNNMMQTALCALAAKALVGGPHVDPFPELPPEAPMWNGRVMCISYQDDWDYPQATEAFTNLCKEGQTINIFGEGTLSNRN